MPLFLVTGPSGSGKSTISLELRKRGFESYDTDDDAMARWRNKTTGYIHPKSSVKAHQRTPEFLANHEWAVPIDFIKALVERAVGQPIFVCGVTANEQATKDYFDKTFALTLQDQVIIDRLQSRTNNDWGRQSHELVQTLADAHRRRSQTNEVGYVSIDANQSLEDVVGGIIAQAGLGDCAAHEPIDFVSFLDQ